MRKLKGILVLVLLLALLASPIAVLASNITGALYYGSIIVSNNSTATTNVAVNCTISTQALIDGGYLNSSANNCVVRSSAGADLPFMPSVNASYPWAIWVPSIGQNSHLSDILYTANSTGGEIRYFPAAGGMTTTDSASLELGGNFTIEQSGWWDTGAGANKTAVSKEATFETFVSDTVSGNITSTIYAAGDWISPTGHNDPEATWAGEAQAYNGNTGDFAASDVLATAWTNFLELTRASLDISGVRFYASGSTADVDAIDIDVYSGGNWHHAYQGAFTQSTWETKGAGRLGVTKARVRLYNSSGGGKLAYIHDFDFRDIAETSVTATGVESGEHTVKTTTNSPGLSFDGNDYITLPGVADEVQALTVGTIEVWAKLDGLGGNQAFYCFSDLSDAVSYMALYWQGGVTDVSAICYEAGGELYNDVFTGAPALVAGNWHHLVLIQDGVAPDLVLDGIKYDMVSGPDDTGWFADILDIDTVEFASRNRSGGRDWFVTGDAGELRIYNRALSVAEAQEHFNGLYDDETGLIGHWILDEGSDTTAIDSSSSSNDGTIVGATWVTCPLLRLYVDDILRATSANATVPDNINDWTYYENMEDYWEYTEVSVNGTRVQYIDWEYGTTFQDSSDYDNDATPTFRTTSSDADVSAILTSFLPISEARAPAYALEDAPAFIETVPTIVSEWAVTPPAGTFPLAGVIAAVASATDTPAQLPLLLIAAFVIIACSLAISATMRRYGSGSLIVKSLVITALMGIFIAIGNFGIDFWMLVVFLIIAVALSMGSKQVGWQ